MKKVSKYKKGGTWKADNKAVIDSTISSQGVSAPINQIGYSGRKFFTPSFAPKSKEEAFPNMTLALAELIHGKPYNIPIVKNAVNSTIYNVADKLSDVAVNTDFIRPYYKKAAYNIMSQSNVPIRTLDEIKKGILSKGNYRGTGSTNKQRDLLKLYIYGDDVEFTQNNLKPIGVEKYENKYGKLKNYNLDVESISNNIDIDTERKEIIEKIKKDGVYSKPVSYNFSGVLPYKINDNVAGHMNYIYKTPQNKYKLRVQDVWKFDPNDYSKKWSYNRVDATDYPLISKIEAMLAEKAGKPFILSEEYNLDSNLNLEKNEKEMKTGGTWKPNNRASVDQYNPQGTVVGQGVSSEQQYPARRLSATEKGIEELRQQERNTTPIGYTPSWQDKVRNTVNKVSKMAPGLYSAIPEALMYPIQAATNLTQPQRYFQGNQREEGILSVAPLAMDIAAVSPIAKGVGKGVKNLIPNRPDIGNRVFKGHNFFPAKGDVLQTNSAYTYRVVDPSAVDDLLESGIVRNKYTAGKSNRAPQYGHDVYWTEGSPTMYYKPDNRMILEVPTEYVNKKGPVKIQDISNIYETVDGKIVPSGRLKDMKRKYAIGGSYQGGPIGKHQWELPSSPNTPGYEDYGTMYYVPGGYGLYEKPRDYSKEYAGYGNPANLLSNQVDTPMNRPKAVNPYNTQDIMKKKAMRQMDTTGRYNNMYLQGEGSTSDYSIDALRQNTMAHGGYAPKRGYFFNGRTMQKAKPGAYDTMWREGGQFQQVPVHQDMYRYGLNLYKDGGMVDVPVPQHMGRYGLMLYKGGGSVPPSYTAFQPNLNGMYKEGGIHIKPENKGKFINPYGNRPYYKNGGVVEGTYDIDVSPAEIAHLKRLGYDVEML